MSSQRLAWRYFRMYPDTVHNVLEYVKPKSSIMMNRNVTYFPVADPGFPVNGRCPPGGGATTPNAGMFYKICMSKIKNCVP